MTALSAELDAAARRNERLILQALASAGIGPAAKAADVDESTVTRWKEKDIPRFCRMLSALGIKCVPRALKCYEPRQMDAILQLAKAHLSEIEGTEQLEWEG